MAGRSFDDGTVELLPMPGQTVRHQSMNLEIDTGTVILGFDIAHQMDVDYEA